MSRPGTSLLLAMLLVVAACSRSAAPTTTEATTTTTSTTTTSTTTTTLPPLQVDLPDAPPDLVPAVTAFFEWLMDPANRPAPPLPEGLVGHLSDVAPRERLSFSAGTHAAEPRGGRLAVVKSPESGDVVVTIDDGSGWRVIGADLPTFGKGPWYGPSPRFVLVIGSDARPGQDPLSQRSDSLHILTAVPEQRAGAIVGIPRDSWLASPSGGRTKITNILASHGPEGVLATVQSLSGLPLEGYLITGFGGFVDLVNAFGSVRVEVPFGMSDRASGAFFQAGEQDMHGWDALAFSRNRHIGGGDFTRSLHQGVVIKAALGQVQQTGIENLPRFVAMLTEFVFTNFSLEQLTSLAATSYVLDPAQVPNVVVPGSVGSVGAASVVFLGDGAQAVFADLADGTLTAPQ